jgi:hypothetical protein
MRRCKQCGELEKYTQLNSERLCEECAHEHMESERGNVPCPTCGQRTVDGLCPECEEDKGPVDRILKDLSRGRWPRGV